MDTPGITRVATADSLGVRGLGCMDLELRDVRVDADALLGAPGDGFRIAHVGARRRPRRDCRAGARRRPRGARRSGRAREDARGVRPADRQLPGDSVDARRHGDRARRGADADAEGGGLVGRGTDDGRARAATPHASMAKLFASEAAHRAADKAMQILASKGYRRGSVVERLFRDVRATEIYQGTSEVQRMVIAEHILL